MSRGRVTPASTRGDRAVRVSMGAVVVGVATVAAWVSYRHAYDVVLAAGEPQATARLVPLTVDGLVFSASLVMLHCARHQLPVPALARGLLALGIVATLAANVLSGSGHGPVGAVIAAWPAVALVGSYELLMWVVRSGGPAMSAVAATVADTGPDTADIEPDTVVDEGQDDVDVAAAAARLLVDEPGLSGAELAQRVGISPRHGRRLRARLTAAAG